MRTTKKAISIVLAGLMTVGGMSVFSVSAAQTSTPTLSFKTQNALYAHAVSGSDDSDAWVAWQCKHNEDMEELNTNRKYFFLPSSVSSTSVELYNAYSKSVTVNNVTIPSGESREVSYTIDKAGNVTADGKTYSLTFLKSSAESAIYVNNSNADGNGKELISYLNEDKSNYSSATGAIVDRNGKIDNTSIKKIKGRGNSTWGKAKKPYNITYSDKVSIGGMSKGKKFSLLANYQDDSLTRNRFLYDLADAVGTPYASDSRYVDFYSDGYYCHLPAVARSRNREAIITYKKIRPMIQLDNLSYRLISPYNDKGVSSLMLYTPQKKHAVFLPTRFSIIAIRLFPVSAWTG